MPVLERSELEASPLADLHAIADQVGVDGFKRLRKAELIDKILAVQGGGDSGGSAPAAGEGDADAEDAPKPSRRRRLIRPRRGAKRQESDETHAEPQDDGPRAKPRDTDAGAGADAYGAPAVEEAQDATADEAEEVPAARSSRSERAPAASRGRRGRSSGEERSAEGVVEVLANGSAFLRVNAPEQSPEDLYISSAQVRRCELVSGDRVSGPVRTPRRSERYASLLRIDTINGAPADEVAAGTRYEDLAADWPSERLTLAASDPTLEAIEWLTPIGRGSRAVVAGPHFSGKSEIVRLIAAALQAQPELTLSAALVGVRPEEITQWQEGPLVPEAALSFAASADAQAQALERVLETARRTAARGGHAVVLLDTLDGLHPHAARKAMSAARNLRDGGSLTVIATASAPVGGETTVIALDPQAAASGRQPIVDLIASGTLRPDLLVGEDGAAAIARARAAALED
jgi:transcription termination factor Rho